METTFDQDPKLRQLALDWLKESYDKLAAAGLLNGQTYQNYPSGEARGRAAAAGRCAAVRCPLNGSTARPCRAPARLALASS